MFHNKEKKINREEHLKKLDEFIKKPFNMNMFCGSYLVCLDEEDRFIRKTRLRSIMTDHGLKIDNFQAYIYLINPQSDKLSCIYINNGEIYPEEKITTQDDKSNLSELIATLKPTWFGQSPGNHPNLIWLSFDKISNILLPITNHSRWTDKELLEGRELVKLTLAKNALDLITVFSTDEYVSANTFLIDLAHKMNYLASPDLLNILFDQYLDRIVNDCIYDLSDLENCINLFPNYEKKIMAHIFAYGNHIDYAERIIKNTFNVTPLGLALHEDDKLTMIYKKFPKYIEEFSHFIKIPSKTSKYHA